MKRLSKATKEAGRKRKAVGVGGRGGAFAREFKGPACGSAVVVPLPYQQRIGQGGAGEPRKASVPLAEAYTSALATPGRDRGRAKGSRAGQEGGQLEGHPRPAPWPPPGARARGDLLPRRRRPVTRPCRHPRPPAPTRTPSRASPTSWSGATQPGRPPHTPLFGGKAGGPLATTAREGAERPKMGAATAVARAATCRGRVTGSPLPPRVL